MMRHLSDEDLARYAEDDLKPRKAAKVRSHLADCSDCQGRLAALEAMPNLLASVQFPPIPERLSTRISMALAAESSARVAGTAASEGDRRELPARGRRGGGRHAPKAPWFTTPLALRAGAAVAAAVVIAGGGYELASHGGPSSSTSSSISGPPASPAQAGPNVSYRHSGHTDSIKAVKSGTDYKSATLASQAALVVAAQQNSASRGSVHANASMSALGSSTTVVPTSGPAPSTGKLQGCVDRIAGGKNVLLVDIAKYLGRSATIIVVGTSARAEVYAVGPGCSSSASDILARQSLHRT
jgi:hypothetical protein